MKLSFLTIAFTACTLFSFNVTAEEWSYSSREGAITVSVSASTCYDQPEDLSIRFSYDEDKGGYNNVSYSANCDCGQDLVLNNKLVLSGKSLENLIKSGIPLIIENYSCKAAE